MTWHLQKVEGRNSHSPLCSAVAQSSRGRKNGFSFGQSVVLGGGWGLRVWLNFCLKGCTKKSSLENSICTLLFTFAA